MAKDFTIIFRAIQEEGATVAKELDIRYSQECSEISELARLSEALKEPELVSYLTA